ncbi:MAG TPA: pyrroloquinoline quinone-dependent dehydrogenase [Candidatus Limnocylindria bacterium]|nr:pyrroloquinoline quinone-dependent dehydrogenase [Candidatus Limnocylindria bacterium]
MKMKLRFLLGFATVASMSAAMGAQTKQATLKSAAPETAAPVSRATPAQPAASGQNDWPMFGHDFSSTRYSPLTQIRVSNVGKLQQAWVYHLKKESEPSRNTATPNRGGRMRNSESTPIVVDGVLYMNTPYNAVVALDPETGKEIWSHSLGAQANATERGVSFWPGDKAKGWPAAILFGTTDGHLVSLNAKTGELTEGFGENGAVDLRAGLLNEDTTERSRINLTSPPMVYKNLVITGGEVQESPEKGMPGDVRAWDAHDGHLVWTFHTVPHPGEVGNDTWPEGAWKNRSGTNVWGFMSVDAQRGLVYLPTGSPTYDFYGADRAGMDLFGNTLLAVHADTGKLAWYFQAIHHDTEDYDLQSAPILFDVKQRGKVIPALGFTSKSGMVFILDRTNGKPVYGVKEVPVPQSVIPGEKRWPTEPVPIKPAPLGLQHYDPAIDGVSKVTPEHEAYCKNMVENSDPVPPGAAPEEAAMHGPMVGGGPFVAFGTRLTVQFPGTLGAVNWHGMSYDPQLGYLFVNVSNIADVGKIAKNPRGSDPPYVRTSPWGTYGRFWEGEKFWPCQPGPWGELLAINVNTGDVAWHEPFGIVPELEARGVTGTGTLSYGGTIATAGGVIFIAGTMDEHFRAFEAKTGKVLWDIKMDTGAYVVPMTYEAKNGKQYVLIVDTGGSYYDRTYGDSVIAWALPDEKPAAGARKK